uniref:Macaca fascicularis brain cDNA clone: QmoA-12569, similar to human DEAD (Asp-Glu-Ala-Asp) box polypeptide 24 (DDX24), mRNA, RefSeq: NM_020414.3 n=1 Tax=Macaca fascicularis TaxID=9541 RepID=I7GJY1_MACFA|nr:unnamed protein product [Macaca fascicularis]
MPVCTRSRGSETWSSLPVWKTVFSWQQMWQLGVWIFLKSSMSSITRSHVPRRFMSTEVVELLELPMKVSA